MQEALPPLVEHMMAAQAAERSIDLPEQLTLVPSWWEQLIPLMGLADEVQAQSTVRVRSATRELQAVDGEQAGSIAHVPVYSQWLEARVEEQVESAVHVQVGSQ